MNELEQLPVNLRLTTLSQKEDEAHLAFYGKHNPHSNFFKSEMVVNNHLLSCADQYFKDSVCAQKILEAESPIRLRVILVLIDGRMFQNKLWKRVLWKSSSRIVN